VRASMLKWEVAGVCAADVQTEGAACAKSAAPLSLPPMLVGTLSQPGLLLPREATNSSCHRYHESAYLPSDQKNQNVSLMHFHRPSSFSFKRETAAAA
jgi:hypothetical protein